MSLSDEIIVAILAFLGTVGGSVGGILASNRLTSHRLDRLERKVDLHNNAVQRLAVLENTVRAEQELSREHYAALQDRLHSR